MEILTREMRGVSGPILLAKQNKPDGFMCVSCAWPKPAEPNAFEYCENGAKATAWELTRRRVERVLRDPFGLRTARLVRLPAGGAGAPHGTDEIRPPDRPLRARPCLGRIEVDDQASGPQAVSVEDPTSCFHGSRGVARPASPHLRSEPWIVAALAKAATPANPRIDWDGWVADYATIRDSIAATYPDKFKDFNEKLFTPGGLRKPVSARDRNWETGTGKANFIPAEGLEADPDTVRDGRSVLNLMTLRSNDQFNTTVYGYDDRFRGVKGTRDVLFMYASDIERLGLKDDRPVDVTTCADDGHARAVHGLRVVEYDIPAGCCAGYYPELNTLIPLWRYDEQSMTPAAKSIPVFVRLSSDPERAAPAD